ncbi:MAG: carboxylating nicotinate-nucleotide diphosphorylase [Dehalococcoidaceae bacterium]|nr:carboxylating nicotinate-nucleotide diphosphorylase [Dehalococcoidaceae bacterium]
MVRPSKAQVDELITRAFEEDRVVNDITSRLCVPEAANAKTQILAKQNGVLAGIQICREVFMCVDPSLEFEVFFQDGAAVHQGDIVAGIYGRAASILAAERTALNFLGWLSGIASLTAQFVDRVKQTPALITDTRKTTPGLRVFEKYAVKTGGGRNHRMHLGDGILIKDNHLAVLKLSGINLRQAVTTARLKAPTNVKVEVEVTSFDEAVTAARAGADIILLDNMGVEEMARVGAELGGKVKLEASGGITLENVAAVALTGVDYISIGALTHSAPNMDFSLEVTG